MITTKILADLYFSQMNRTEIIGIVACDISLPDKKIWAAYIAICTGEDQKDDRSFVANYGQRLTPEVAHAFFPHLNINEYKSE